MPGEAEFRRRRHSYGVPLDRKRQVRAHAKSIAANGIRAVRHSHGQASPRSPSGSVLRANPCPEVTDPVCRLPLPTLFYRPEAFHLGDLLRIWVRACTKITLSPSDFQGSTRAHRTPQEPWCFTKPWSLSPGEPLPGSRLFTKKRELFPGLAPTSLSSFALPHLTPWGAHLRVKVREC